MTKLEPKPLHRIKLLSILVVLGAVVIVGFWFWWNQKGIFNISSSSTEKTDYSEGIKYIAPSVQLQTFEEDNKEDSDGITRDLECAVEYTDNNVEAERIRQRKLQERLARKQKRANPLPSPEVTPFGPFGSDQNRTFISYIQNSLEKSIVSSGEHLIPYLVSGREAEDIRRSVCADVGVNIKSKQQADHILFQVTTTYSRQVRAQLKNSPLIHCIPCQRSSYIFVSDKKNAMARINSVMQAQVKDCLASVHNVSASGDRRQDLRRDPEDFPIGVSGHK